MLQDLSVSPIGNGIADAQQETLNLNIKPASEMLPTVPAP